MNLNPDKICNFDCIYCQVNRISQSETRFVETDLLLDELDQTLSFVETGEIYDHEKLHDVPASLRRLNDIAFSGDGEPTTYKNFDEIVSACDDVRRRHGLDDVKLVLITNASMFHRPHVRRGLEVIDRAGGEIWAKLEAGTKEYFQLVDRTPIPFQQILDNIRDAAIIRPIVIQALFMRIDGQPPSTAELEAFCDRLNVSRRKTPPIKKGEIINSMAAEKYGISTSTLLDWRNAKKIKFRVDDNFGVIVLDEMSLQEQLKATGRTN